MMQVVLIRHAKTAGNLEKRYVGTTDEPLCGQGIAELKKQIGEGIYPEAAGGAKLFTSPMKRCVETAAMIYPDLEPETADGLRECDFGDFEYKNYMEMNGDPAYQAWIDSGGTAPFPGGESPDDFRRRSLEAFQQIVSENRACPQLIFVVHGGTVMSVMSALGEPAAGYFDRCVDNGRGYVCERTPEGRLRITGEI